MTIKIEIQQDYAELYGINVDRLPEPAAGESFRDYMKRSGLGKEEDVLLVVDGVSKPLSHVFSEGEGIKIYPMAASG